MLCVMFWWRWGKIHRLGAYLVSYLSCLELAVGNTEAVNPFGDSEADSRLLEWETRNC